MARTKIAVKKPATYLERYTLLALHESATHSSSNLLEIQIFRAVKAVADSLEKLREKFGLRLPKISLNWHRVRTEDNTVLKAILAYDGRRELVRVVISPNYIEDDTTENALNELNISYLIGIAVLDDEDSCLWKSELKGQMLGRVNVSERMLGGLLHDIFLDMAIVKAKEQYWSPLISQLSISDIAALKAKFAKKVKQSETSIFNLAENAIYFPLCSLARNGEDIHEIDTNRCVEYWHQFTSYLKDIPAINLDFSRRVLVNNIIQNHLKGGQISESKLENALYNLNTGYYKFYFLNRGTDNKNKINHISTFFERNPDRFRTQWWIIRPSGQLDKLGKLLVEEGFISEYPFYIGDL